MPANTAPDSAENSLTAFIASRGVVAASPAGFARQVLRVYFKTHWQLDIDPDDVRLNTFIYNAVPGATHCPALLHTSLSLTDALLIKWQRHLTSMWSGLGYVQAYRPGGVPLQLVPMLDPRHFASVYEGLYRRSEPQVYDATTCINIDPAQIKAFIWQTDLRKQYLDYLNPFIREHAKDFPVLGKAALLKAVFLQREENSLRLIDQQLVLRGLGLDVSQQWQSLTPAQLTRAVHSDPDVTVAALQVHRYRATAAMIIGERKSGRAVLYLPGNSSPLHGFDSERSLAQWVAQQCRDEHKRLVFESYFRERDDGDGLFLSGVRNTLKGISIYPRRLNDATGSWLPRHVVHSAEPVTGDPFVHVRDRMIERLQSDATQSIRTRGSARLEGFALGLDRSLMFTGVVALIVPEAAALIIGLSLALIAVGADQAATGRTLRERQAGGQRVVFGLLNALPIGAEQAISLLGNEIPLVTVEYKTGASEGVESVDLQSLTSVHPLYDIAPPNLRSLTAQQRTALRGFEAPASELSGDPTIHGPNGMRDIYHRDGRYFLLMHDRAYRTRWEAAVRQWRLVSADENAFPGPFVRQLDNGQWDIDIGGLKGGMQGDQVVPISTVTSGTRSLSEQVTSLYPGFTPAQAAEFLDDLRASGVSVEIQLARQSTEFNSLERALERWSRGPVTWRVVSDTHSVPVSEASRRQAAAIIKRCWQRQTPVGDTGSYALDLRGITVGDLPHLPGDFSHVTVLDLSRTCISEQSASELLSKMPHLRWLSLENNFMRSVPVNVAARRNLTRLSLANNRITLTPLMMSSLRPLRNLRLLNLERNPLGPLLDVTGMPRLVNLFLRGTGLEQAPTGVFDLPELVALDLRNNRISTLPDPFYTSPWARHHTLLDNNPLSSATQARITGVGGAPFATEPLEGVDVWLENTSALGRAPRRTLWGLYEAEEGADSFFEILTRLRSSADFNHDADSVTHRVWQLMEAGADDPALRRRLVAMAANPETCVDGATVIFSNMEQQVLVSKAIATAASGHEGASLLMLLRGLWRLEEVDDIALRDVAARVGFTEDVEVLLAYRVGLATRLELPVGSHSMHFSTSAGVSQAALDRAAAWVLARETPDALVAFALQRDFWCSYLEGRYPAQFVACRKATELRMSALDELQAQGTMASGAYKNAADAILLQRKADEQGLMTQLTQAEIAGSRAGNSV